jgi:hypothetical protein
MAAIILLVIIFLEPEISLFILTSAYLLSGPVYTLLRRKGVVTEGVRQAKEGR